MRKKQLLFLLILVSLCLSLNFVALAHHGNTDDDGGHTDSSTGEYHYHHGQEAHSHYDMDGDGDIDCPYDFVDITNHNSYDTEDEGSDYALDTNSPSRNIARGVVAIFLLIIPIGLYLLHVIRSVFVPLRKNTLPKAVVASSPTPIAISSAPLSSPKTSVHKFDIDEFAFVNGFRYARISLSVVTQRFNIFFNSNLTALQIYTAYHAAAQLYSCSNTKLTFEAVDMIQTMLSQNFSWQEITAWINYMFHMSCGPNELKKLYIFTSSLPTT